MEWASGVCAIFMFTTRNKGEIHVTSLHFISNIAYVNNICSPAKTQALYECDFCSALIDSFTATSRQEKYIMLFIIYRLYIERDFYYSKRRDYKLELSTRGLKSGLSILRKYRVVQH